MNYVIKKHVINGIALLDSLVSFNTLQTLYERNTIVYQSLKRVLRLQKSALR